jgi:hypothetical protein
MSIWSKRADGAPAQNNSRSAPAIDIPPNPIRPDDRPPPPPPSPKVRRLIMVRAEAIRRPQSWVRLRPIRSGKAFRIVSPSGLALVRPELADALETVFERFALERRFEPRQRLSIEIARGHAPTSAGHYEGRAADISAVGGIGFLEWSQRWHASLRRARATSGEGTRRSILRDERRKNVGFALYEALREHGGWRVNDGGWRPYLGVAQLFGPWTPVYGPWRKLRIDSPDAAQRQRIADQDWVFRAHQDHIHVAR